MNGTERGAKGHHEQDMEPLGISMFWNIERRDMSGASGEGI